MTDDARTFRQRAMSEEPTLAAATAPLTATVRTMATGVAGGGVPGTASYVPAAGYALGELIGRGGMGEVVAATCQRIGREVAIKRMRTADPAPDQIARFLREARVQGRLDHPAIVPVHELGYDDAGQPYFAMKRLAGVTLAELIATRAATTQRLLRAVVDVCLAIQLAHERGVVHRDLKPANIILGNYGEVYVLDWGIARVLADQVDAVVRPTEVDPTDATRTGDLLGTPGYMPPEQARGELVDKPADVYALGAILFEVLAGEPLHPRGHGALVSTLAAPDPAPPGPAARSPDANIAPELDAACVAALATSPARRPTARELADRIQHFLDGDRDVERRRVLAAEQLAAARAAFASGAPDARATAMRLAGRALALDPGSDAAAMVSRLMLEPPAELPADLSDSLEAEERRISADRSRKGALALLALLALAALLPGAHVKSWPQVVGTNATVALLAGIAWFNARRPIVAVTTVGLLLLTLEFARVSGPFMVTPIIGCGVMMAISANPWFEARRWLVVAWIVAVTAIPVGLEAAHVLEPTWGIADGVVWMRSAVYDVHPAFGAFALILSNIVLTVALVALAHSIHCKRRVAQRTIQIQAWHLHQLLPKQPSTTEVVR